MARQHERGVHDVVGRGGNAQPRELLRVVGARLDSGLLERKATAAGRRARSAPRSVSSAPGISASAEVDGPVEIEQPARDAAAASSSVARGGRSIRAPADGRGAHRERAGRRQPRARSANGARQSSAARSTHAPMQRDAPEREAAGAATAPTRRRRGVTFRLAHVHVDDHAQVVVRGDRRVQHGDHGQPEIAGPHRRAEQVELGRRTRPAAGCRPARAGRARASRPAPDGAAPGRRSRRPPPPPRPPARTARSRRRRPTVVNV